MTALENTSQPPHVFVPPNTHFPLCPLPYPVPLFAFLRLLLSRALNTPGVVERGALQELDHLPLALKGDL